MSFKWIDHVVIAVKDMDQAISTYRDKLGLKLRGINNAPELGIKQAHFDLGDGRFIELAEPLGPETAVGRSIERRGEGIHILAVAVENMEKTKEEYESKGIQLIADGDQVFLHPKSTNGVLIQLIERPS
jgi:methylmalonyl-CoA epimerase